MIRWSRGGAGAAEIAWAEAIGTGERGMIWWTSGGRAGAAEIPWQEARDG